MPSRVKDSADGPATKRQKLSSSEVSTKPRRSRIFAPYRTIGLVSSTDVPFTSIPLGKTTFQITTSVGRSLHTYDLRRGLNLTFLTRPQTPATITAIFAWKDRIFAAWGSGTPQSPVGVSVFKRGKQVAQLEPLVGLDEPIKQIIIFGSWIVACCSSRIDVWKSTNYEHYTTLFPAGSHDGSTGGILSGVVSNMPTLLNKVLVGKTNGGVDLWNLSTGKLIYTISPPGLKTGPVTALQPTPALSLLAIGRANGSITIHNVRTDKEVIRLNSNSSSHSSITSISFRTDGLGAGEDGRDDGVMVSACKDNGDVTIWDLNKGGRVMGVLRNAHNPSAADGSGVLGGINKVEFLSAQPVMVTSGRDNSLKSWIFDESPYSPIPRILHKRAGHAAPVTRLDFLPAESDGADAIGKWLMSASKDQSLWGWSLRRDGQSTELSQGNIQKKARKLGLVGKAINLDSSTSLEDLKAPEITCLACSLNRDGGMGSSTGGGAVWANVANKKSNETTDNPATGWESIVTGHKGDKYARTWFWGRKKAGRWAFETKDGSEVKSVAISPCGTFALVGSANGGIDMFNLQSGIHRQRFPSPLTPAQARKLKIERANAADSLTLFGDGPRTWNIGEGRHKKAVTGIIVDSLNRTVISCSLDGTIKFWDFATGILRHEINWFPMTGITASRYYRSSDLVALSCDDLSIRVVDIETKKLVREFWGCVGQITDFCFSNDGRWIIAASIDSVLRVWDLPTGHLIDAVRIESACTSLAFSTTGEFLATAHVDTPGINIWTNRTLFTHVPTRHLSEDDIVLVALPTASGEGGEGLLGAVYNDDSPEDDSAPSSTALLTSPDQLAANLMTLSLVPRARWQTLLHLDTIAARNKPIEPPKAPEKAPFFLPSLDQHKPIDQPNPTPALPQSLTGTSAPTSRLLTSSGPQISEFTALLRATTSTASQNTPPPTSDNSPAALNHLATLSPSVADITIRSLSSHDLPIFIHALTARLRQRRDYELVHTWMAVFLRCHGESVIADADGVMDGEDEEEAVREGGGLRAALREWQAVQAVVGKGLGERVGGVSGVLGWLRGG